MIDRHKKKVRKKTRNLTNSYRNYISYYVGKACGFECFTLIELHQLGRKQVKWETNLKEVMREMSGNEASAMPAHVLKVLVIM